MQACTAIMGNFLPHARVLAQSFHEHHPGTRMTILVVDHDADSGREPFDAVRPWDLALPREEVDRILTLFDGAMPAGALRGALVRHLLQAHSEPVLFLDPDAQVFAPLNDIGRLAAQHGIVLSPHLMGPPACHGGFAGDHTFLLAGAFNSGFLAVGPGGASFLDWWAARLQRWTLLAPTEGYYGTQRWLDLVPAMFPHHVLDDPGCNVMTINARERALRIVPGGYFAGAHPLRLFHFGGGFDPKQPYLTGPGYAPEEALLSEHGCLAALHRRYAEALLASGWDDRPALSPPLELAPDTPLDATMRALYREALLASEEQGTAEPPNPYAHGSTAFVEWLKAPSDQRRNARTISRYLQARWHTGALAVEFPDLVGGDAGRYLSWARSSEGATAGIPASLAEPTQAPCKPVPVTSLGVNIVAADGGLAEYVGQRLTDELRAAGEGVAYVSYPRAASERRGVVSLAGAVAVNDVTILCLRPGVVADFDYDLGVLFRPGRHIILALVDSAWSTDELAIAAKTVDEVWCWDSDTAAEVRRACELPAAALPFPVIAQSRASTEGDLVCWADLGEPGHGRALMDRVRSYVNSERGAGERLHIRLTEPSADRVTAETVWGLAESNDSLVVGHVAGWREALEGVGAVLSLGSSVGPFEAEARCAGIAVIPTDGGCHQEADVPSPAQFGEVASTRLASLPSRRSDQ
jgi:hypothetical protein